MLTPLDLHGKKFNKTFRGYDSEEIDEFFAQVVKDFERLYQDNIELKEALERASTKLEYFEQMETTMHNTLAVAQETAEEVKRNGRKELEVLTRESEVARQKLMNETTDKCLQMTKAAEEHCKNLAEDTEKKCAELVAQADAQVRASEAALREQRRSADTHRRHMRTLLEGQLELMRKAEKEHF